MERDSNLDSLLNFFKILDDENAFYDLKKELIIEFCENYHKFVKSIDFNSGVVEIEHYDPENLRSEILIYIVADEIQLLVNKNTRDIKNEIDNIVNNAIILGKDINIILQNINSLLIAVSKREFKSFSKLIILKALTDITSHIEKNYNYFSDYSFTNSFQVDVKDFCKDSYMWKSIDGEVRIYTLKKLYKLLTEEPKIIDCSEEEFIKAFSQSKITDGIKWCVLGKNKDYSKQSLLAFIEYLSANNYIEAKSKIDFNKAIIYVFRNHKGEIIKNISISKSATTNQPTEWERIKEILNKI